MLPDAGTDAGAPMGGVCRMRSHSTNAADRRLTNGKVERGDGETGRRGDGMPGATVSEDRSLPWRHCTHRGVTARGQLWTPLLQLYDPAADPHQLTNIFRTASASLKAELHARLFTQWGCAESKCD